MVVGTAAARLEAPKGRPPGSMRAPNERHARWSLGPLDRAAALRWRGEILPQPATSTAVPARALARWPATPGRELASAGRARLT